MLRHLDLRKIRSRPSRAAVPFVVLVVGLLATTTVAFFGNSTARAKDQARFDNAAEDLRLAIANRIDTYVALLRAGAGLFAGSRDVTRAEFERFVDRLELRERYPGIQGIGFSLRIRAGELDRVVGRVRADGTPRFDVWPTGDRPEYFPIVYLEPLDRRNQAAIGYDMFDEPVRREAMESAARRATATASGKVRLVQEIDLEKQAGFHIYVPIYRTGVPPVTEGARLEALWGFIYSPFRAGDFLSAALGSPYDRLVDFQVFDGGEARSESLMFETHVGGGPVVPHLQRTIRLDVTGRPWLLVVSSLPGFEAMSDVRLQPWIVAIGVGISLLLFVATMVEVRARTVAERAAMDLQRSEEALRASEAELRRVVEAERHAHAEASAANRAKDDFLATLSHELRTPLNAILGWASMLKSGQLPAAQQAHALDVIARNARTQAELIDDLLDVSRIITGKLRIELRAVLLASAVQAALDAVGPAAEAKGVHLEWHIDTDGPVLGDPDRLQQVAWNLLTNAIKFTEPGGRVTVVLEAASSEVVFRVTDTGVGISPEFLPAVFERFRQRDSSTTRKYGGMGLGLAIVRHLVEAHGGTVRADSPGEGQGATFAVTLPMRVTSGRDASGDRGKGAVAARQELAAVRALVVDDEADSRELLTSALAGAGASVRGARSAADALDALSRERFDVLVADIGMPEADGYELLRLVRSHGSPDVRATPAIAVTAYARSEDRAAAEAAGFQLHVAKPVDVHLLLAAIRRLIRT